MQNIWLHLCPSLSQPAPASKTAKQGDHNMLSLSSTVEGERKSQHKETQHGNFKRFNFPAHGPAVDECQTAPLPDKRIQQSWRFPQGISYHLIILPWLHCPASHISGGSCSHLEGSTALLHTENTHYHWTGIELAEPQMSALTRHRLPLHSMKKVKYPPQWQFTNLKHLRNRTNHQGQCSLQVPSSSLTLLLITRARLKTNRPCLFCSSSFSPRTERIYRFTRSPLSYCSFPGGCSPTYSVFFALTGLPYWIQNHTETSYVGTYAHLDISGSSETLEAAMHPNSLYLVPQHHWWPAMWAIAGAEFPSYCS